MLGLGILLGMLLTIALTAWLSSRRQSKFDAHAVKVINLPDGRLVLKMFSEHTVYEATVGGGSAYVLARDLDTAIMEQDGGRWTPGGPWLHLVEGGGGDEG